MIHAAALHRLEFHIQSPSPSPRASSKPEPDGSHCPLLHGEWVPASCLAAPPRGVQVGLPCVWRVGGVAPQLIH